MIKNIFFDNRQDNQKGQDSRGNRNPPPQKGGGNFFQNSKTALFWIAIFLALAIIMQFYGPLKGDNRIEIPYSVYKKELQNSNVSSVIITGEEIRGKFNKPITIANHSITEFRVFIPERYEAVKELSDYDVYIETRPSSQRWWQIIGFWGPVLFFIVFWIFFLRQMQMGGNKVFSFGKSKAKIAEDKQKVTFADVAGADEAKQELQEIIEFLKEPEKFKRLGGRIPKGALLLGPPGTGKCITGESIIITNKGLIEIKDIPQYFWVDPQTNCVAGAILPSLELTELKNIKELASHWYNLGRQKTIKIITKQGISIEGTPEHPVIIMTSDGLLRFKELSNITEGDLVALKFNTQIFGNLKLVDEQTAYLMGLLTGDGNMSISNRITLTTTDEELSTFFIHYVKSKYPDKEIHHRENDYIVCSWQMKKALYEAGMSCLLSYNKSIPFTIMQAPKDVIVAFLQGLFDTDGYFFSPRGIFGYDTVSKKLAEQLSAILLNLGIVPKISIKSKEDSKHPRPVYRITVSGTELPKFAKQIGFRLKRKKQDIENYLEKEGTGINTNVDVFYYIDEMILSCWQELSKLKVSNTELSALIDKVRDRHRISRNSLLYFINHCNKIGYENEKTKYLSQLLNADLFFSPIEKVEEGFAEVYDFTVPTSHSFISNGFISHNTLLARAVAGEAGVPFFSMSGSDFVEMFVGVGASRVRDLFEQGKKNAPCIIFVDELDAVGRHRGAGLGGGHDEREQTLNQLLVEMDGFDSNEGVILIAATNRPDVLDPALLRPGRFDRQIVVDRPDVKGREGILKVHTKKIPLAPDVKLDVLARGTPGFVGADLANMVNEAALLAARKNRTVVTMEDFEEAKDKVLMGPERKSLLISEAEKKITAYHESGHVLVSKLIPGADPIHKVTIIPRGRALGLTQQLPVDEKYTHPKSYFEAEIAMLLGGRCAEEIVFNEFSTGSANDIQKATELARKMVCEWGMSDKLGPLTFGEKSEEIFLGREFNRHRNYSETTAVEIDNEVRRIVEEGYKKAKELIKNNREKLDKLAKALLERESLDGEEINEILNFNT